LFGDVSECDNYRFITFNFTFSKLPLIAYNPGWKYSYNGLILQHLN